MSSEYEMLICPVISAPETRLLAAMLARSLDDLRSKNQREVREAVQWFIHDDNDTDTHDHDERHLGFTFTDVLEALLLSEPQVRMITNKVKEAMYVEYMPERKAG